MLLAIDVGNTHAVFGLFSEDKLLTTWRLQSEPNRTVDEYALEIFSLLQIVHPEVGTRKDGIKQIIISCVVPSLQRAFVKVATKYFQIDPLVVSSTMDLGIQIQCDSPASVGADRLVNAVAAKTLFGTPAVVVDFGTATTFDVVSVAGNYEGGLIAPGVMISLEALTSRTAQLPSIELGRPAQLVGKNTQQAMLSGVFFGYLELVDGILDRLKGELGKEVHILATGGLARIFSRESRNIQNFAPDLTLQGLKVLADRYRR